MYNEIIVIDLLYNDKQPPFTGGPTFYRGGGRPPPPPPAGYAPEEEGVCPIQKCKARVPDR